MKRILFMTMAVILTLNVSAQQNGLPQFLNKAKGTLDPASISGLYIYDTDVLLDNIKVKRNSKKALVSDIVEQYNASLNGLKSNNMNSLVGLGIDLKDIFSNKTYMDIWNARSDYKDNVASIKEERNVLHTDMEAELMEILTRRQKRKWHKYQAQLENDLSGQFDLSDVFTYIGM